MIAMRVYETSVAMLSQVEGKMRAMKYEAKCSICNKVFTQTGDLMPVAGSYNVPTPPHRRLDNDAIPCIGEGQPLIGLRLLRDDGRPLR